MMPGLMLHYAQDLVPDDSRVFPTTLTNSKITNVTKRDAGKGIKNTQSKTASAIFSACNAPLDVTLLW